MATVVSGPCVATSPLWHLKACPLFANLSETELGEVFRKSRIITLDAKTVIPAASEEEPALWAVKRGYVSMKLMDEEGSQMTVCLLEPGDVFGSLSPDPGERYGEFYRSVTSVCLCRIPTRELNELMGQYPNVAYRMAKAGLDRVHRLQVRMADLLLRPVEARVAFVLLELDRILGEDAPNGHRKLTAHISHMELAQLVGSSREMVTHVLHKFAANGIIDTRNRGLVLGSIKTLEDIRDEHYKWSNS